MENPNLNILSDEITLKELILKVQEFFNECVKKWWLIGIILIPFIAYALYLTYTTPITYSFKVKFAIEGQSSPNLGGLGSLLGGVSSSSSSNISPPKVEEFALSSGTAVELVFTKLGDEYVGNRLIDLYDFDWEEKEKYKDFRLRDSSFLSYSTKEKKLIKSCVNKLVGTPFGRSNALVQLSFDEDTGIFELNTNSREHDLSLLLGFKTYERIKTFFESDLFKEKQKVIDLLEVRLDSLNTVFDSKSFALAQFRESSLGLISQRQKVKEAKLELELQTLSKAIGQVSSNFEGAKFDLDNTKPLFYIISESYQPLSAKIVKLPRTMLFYGSIGCFIGILFVCGRKLYRDIMA